MNHINYRYTVIEKLGEGATGSVFLVEDMMYGRVQRALKIIRVAGMGAEGENTLRNEFSLLRQFDHPNIVKVYDFGSVIVTDSGEHSGDFFITLDYIRGKDLFHATEHADDVFISSLVFQIAYALEYIHYHNLIHFDIKPENIIVTEMQVGDVTVHIPKIIDFGFAAPLFGSIQGYLRGSIHYIAPELIGGKKYDHRTDLYSLGVTFYQILTRSLPFDSDDPLKILKMHQSDTAASITALRPHAQPELVEIVSSLLEKDPRNRIQSARGTAEKLRHLVEYPERFEQYIIKIPSKEFIGRDAEVRSVMTLLQRKYRGTEIPDGYEFKKAICVTGEQGVGKSPFLEECRRRAQLEDIPVIGIHCYLKTSPPLDPFRWFLHELKFTLQPHGTQARELLAEYVYLFSVLSYDGSEAKSRPSIDLANEEKQLEFLRSIVRLVKEAYAVVPFAVSIDDVHLADEMSIQLIRMLIASDVAQTPFFLVSSDSISVAHEKLGLEKQEAEMIVLSGYDENDIANLMKSQFGVPSISHDTARALLENVGDSPYLIKEYLDQFCALPPEVIPIELEKSLRFPKLYKEFPQSINEVYTRRFQKFGYEEQMVLRTLSCFRIPVDKEILGLICSYVPDRLYDLLTVLSLGGTLRYFENGQKVHYSHAGFRQFIYANLHTDREHIQEHIADVLEKYYGTHFEPIAEEIGYHYKEAGVKRKAFAYYSRAAERAFLAYSLQESIVLLEEAINLTSDETEFETTLEKLAHRNDLVENYEKAEAIFNTLLLRDSVPLSKRYSYLKSLGSIQVRRGLFQNAMETFTKASRAARTPGEVMEVEDELADIDISQGRLVDARNRCLNVLVNSSEHSNILQTSSLLTKLGIISFYETKYDEATEYFLRAFQILEQHGDKTKLIVPLLNLGNVYSVNRDYGKALDCWNQALRHAEDVGNLHQQGQIYNNLAIADYSRGRFDEALNNYLKGIEIFERLENSPGLALCLINIGEVYYIHSEFEKALDAWERCFDLYTKINDAHGRVVVQINLSQLFLMFDDTETARDYLQKSRQIIEIANLEAKWPIYYLCCSGIALKEKKITEAEEYALEAKVRLQSIGDGMNCFKALLTLGRIYRQKAHHRSSTDYFREALTKSTELNIPQFTAESLMELGIESRIQGLMFEKKTLVYLKEAYELIKHETVNDLTWKLCYEIGKEYASRGLDVKSKEYFLRAKYSLLYSSTLYTREKLKQKFWDSENRGTVLKEIEKIIKGG